MFDLILSTSQRVEGQTPAPPHNFHHNTSTNMEHGAGAAGDAFSAVRGLMVLRSAAGTVHTVGCPSVLHAGHLSEVNLCRTCVRTPPTPDHLLFVGIYIYIILIISVYACVYIYMIILYTSCTYIIHICTCWRVTIAWRKCKNCAVPLTSCAKACHSSHLRILVDDAGALTKALHLPSRQS